MYEVQIREGYIRRDSVVDRRVGEVCIYILPTDGCRYTYGIYVKVKVLCSTVTVTLRKKNTKAQNVIFYGDGPNVNYEFFGTILKNSKNSITEFLCNIPTKYGTTTGKQLYFSSVSEIFIDRNNESPKFSRHFSS